MKTVLIAWELGGELGHLMRAAAFARQFAKQGLRVIAALDDLANAHLAQWPQGIQLLQAPRQTRPLTTFTFQASYAEILYSCGYHDSNNLISLVTAWCGLMDLTRADVVLSDHAPTAQLAARMSKIPVVRVGAGFFAPPPVSPFPPFRTWQAINHQRMVIAEAKALEAVNAVLSNANLPAARSLWSTLQPDLELITGWPELDCYAPLRPPGSAIYVGHEPAGGGSAPDWPHAQQPGRKKIFAYLKGDYAAHAAVLQGLSQGYSVLAYVTQFNDRLRRKFAGPNLSIVDKLVDLVEVSRSCDAAICHAGGVTTGLFLQAGKPLMLLPYQAEQRSTALLVESLGAGVYLDESAVGRDFADRLAKLTSDPAYAVAARTLADSRVGKGDAATEGVTRIMALLNASPRITSMDPAPGTVDLVLIPGWTNSGVGH